MFHRRLKINCTPVPRLVVRLQRAGKQRSDARFHIVLHGSFQGCFIAADRAASCLRARCESPIAAMRHPWRTVERPAALRCVRRPIIKRSVPLRRTLIRLQWGEARETRTEGVGAIVRRIAGGSHGRAMQSARCRVAATPISHCASIGYSPPLSLTDHRLNDTIARTHTHTASQQSPSS
jgi:hypothetical protein